MLHLTTTTEARIRDLHATAAELRHARDSAPDHRFGWTHGLRLRIGASLLAAGTALVSGARPVTPSRAGR